MTQRKFRSRREVLHIIIQVEGRWQRLSTNVHLTAGRNKDKGEQRQRDRDGSEVGWTMVRYVVVDNQERERFVCEV